MPNNLTIQLRANNITINGYVNAVGRNSKLLNEKGIEFYEQIKPGAFKRALANNSNIPLLIDHDHSQVITRNGENMELVEDNIGLKINCNTDNKKVIENKDSIQGFSFGFRPIKTRDVTVNDSTVREIEELELTEVSLLINKIPAYDGTLASVRSIDDVCIRSVDEVEKIDGEKGATEDTLNTDNIDKEIKEKENEQLNFKELEEKIEELTRSIAELVNKAGEETRALNEEESEKIDELRNERDALKKTLEVMQEERKRASENVQKIAKNHTSESDEDVEVRALADYIKGVQTRDLKYADNKVIIPKTISNKIIEKIKELCPITKYATVIHAKGELVFPVNDDNLGIKAKYVGEFEDLTPTATKFTEVKLETYIIGACAKISKQLINNATFNIVDYVVKCVSQAISELIEKTAIAGETGKFEGLFAENAVKQVVQTAKATEITLDDMLDLQMAILQPFQANAVWLMNRETLATVRKLKTADGEYLLNRDLTNEFAYRILGRGVILSENAPKFAKGKVAIVYGDLSGLYIKISKDVQMEVLREKYAEQYAVGVVAHTELDMKVVEPQKIAALKVKAS